MSQTLTLHLGFKHALLKLLAPRAKTGCVVDVGANLGQTLYEAYKVDSGLRYYGFEPNPQAFVLLAQVARHYNVSAELFPWACSDRPGPLRLFTSSAADTSATILPETRPDTYEGSTGSWIAAYPLDQVSPSLDLVPGFILKIDVEGAENEVLLGAVETVARYRPFILCEVLHAHRASESPLNDSRKAALEQQIEELGYTLYSCDLSRDGARLQGLTRIDGFPRNTVFRDAPHTCDYVFAPTPLD